ncbi:hypothetical protein, partial [Streptomyces tendae]
MGGLPCSVCSCDSAGAGSDEGDDRVRRSATSQGVREDPLAGTGGAAGRGSRAEAGNQEAVEEFWKEAAETGSPLMEPTDDAS